MKKIVFGLIALTFFNISIETAIADSQCHTTIVAEQDFTVCVGENILAREWKRGGFVSYAKITKIWPQYDYDDRFIEVELAGSHIKTYLSLREVLKTSGCRDMSIMKAYRSVCVGDGLKVMSYESFGTDVLSKVAYPVSAIGIVDVAVLVGDRHVVEASGQFSF